MTARRLALLLLVLVCVVELVPPPAHAQKPPTPLLPGQSATLMPDGRWLLLGGQGANGPVAGAMFFDPRTGNTTAASWTLVQPRAWHTATLLPDGAVLVLGGVGAGSQVLATAELFDVPTQAFYAIANPGLTARYQHTATLLTDGFLLIAGGVGPNGTPLAQAELLDGQVPTMAPIAIALVQARQGATATLLPDGTVLLWAGVGPNGPLTTGEVFDPITQQSVVVTQMPPGAQPGPTPPGLADSLPSGGATDVPVDALLVLRFSKPLQVDTLNGSTVALSGPGGLINATVVPAEGGRLAFISPADVLFPGATYMLTINGPGDASGLLLPITSFVFTTAVAQAQPPGGPQPPGSHGHQPIIPEPAAPRPGVPALLDDWSWRGDLKDGKPHSRWMDLPPLQAAAGVTALAGQVLRLDGEPLANVTLQYGGRLATTDTTGRFLLTGISDGYHPLLMQGHTANAPGKTYGTFEYGVPVEAKQTTVLPFTIWMPLLDTEHAIALPGGVTQRKIIATTPKILGLEVHIPAGVTLRTPDGHPLELLSLTPIPLDRTPFPVEPGALFFIAPQGHGTMVEAHDGAMALAGQGVRVIFPNVANHPPGTKLRFRSYDPVGFGWYTIGQLTVSADGRQIAAAPGVTLGEIGCVWILDPDAQIFANLGDEDLEFGDPVNAASGFFLYRKTDLMVPDVIPIVLRRLYRSDDTSPAYKGDFGIGTRHDYTMTLSGDGLTYAYADLRLGDGRTLHYTRISPGTGLTDAVMEHTATPTRWYKSQLYWVGSTGWEIKLTDGTRYQYKSYLHTGPRLIAIVDRWGNTLTLTRNSLGQLDRITSPNGRWVEFTNDPTNGQILAARDNAGRQISYLYYDPYRLWKVTDVAGGVTEYTYDPTVTSRVVTIKDARGIVFLTNHYDGNGRVDVQTLADSGIWQFAYTVDGNGKVTQTDATNPRGFVTRAVFNTDGWETSVTRALGQPEQQMTTYDRQPGTNFLNFTIDALNRQTTYTYTPTGFLQSVTRPGPNGNVTWNYAYEPTFNRIQSITDPLNHPTTFAYDDVARTLNITDPRGKITTITYDPQGRPLTVKDPLTHTWTLTYDGPDLATIKNPLNQTTTRFSDAVGRLVSLKDPLGNQTRYTWNTLNHLTGITDAVNGLTQFGYDPNGNLLSVQDARGGLTQFAPDVMDRVQTRTDALLHPETRTYDPNGNLKTVLDRKNQLRTYTYDALDRRSRVDFADGSFTTSTRDAGNRLTQIVDSITGTITRTPDILNRLQQEVTPQGTVSYTYDNANRRATMTVLGQPQVVYGYDNANRLTTITQGSTVVTIGYDDANRRTSLTLTLPTSVQALYGYDNANRLTTITFKKGATTLGTLIYTYDAARRRATLAGTWGRTSLPSAVASASYNANNQQLTWGGQGNTFDLNGNLATDGTNTYTWDARNRLAAISGGIAASFQYDPRGPRTRKTITGQTTDFLYDRRNPVQELSGGTVLANLLTGLRIDEHFTRTDGSGRRTFLGDALGSILALSDDVGTVQTSYTYEPFGNTVVAGQANGNPLQYTGRENDTTGLYHHRARYYSPALHRFVSEDPIRFRGGDTNLYAYVRGSPINLTDPRGLIATTCGGITLQVGSDMSGLGGRKDGAGEDEGAEDSGSADDEAGGDDGRDEDDSSGGNGGSGEDSPQLQVAMTPDCRAIKQQCIDGCIDVLPTRDHGMSFFNCVNRCMQRHGCL